MCSRIEKNAVSEAYEQVRSDTDNITWIYIGTDGSSLNVLEKGTDFESMRNLLKPNERAFFFVRLTVGDEMSVRAKFALITWIGNETKPMQKARVAMEKSLVKNVIQNFAVELTYSEISECTAEAVAEAVRRAGGANYGTG